MLSQWFGSSYKVKKIKLKNPSHYHDKTHIILSCKRGLLLDEAFSGLLAEAAGESSGLDIVRKQTQRQATMMLNMLHEPSSNSVGEHTFKSYIVRTLTDRPLLPQGVYDIANEP